MYHTLKACIICDYRVSLSGTCEITVAKKNPRNVAPKLLKGCASVFGTPSSTCSLFFVDVIWSRHAISPLARRKQCVTSNNNGCVKDKTFQEFCILRVPELPVFSKPQERTNTINATTLPPPPSPEKRT